VNENEKYELKLKEIRKNNNIKLDFTDIILKLLNKECLTVKQVAFRLGLNYNKTSHKLRKLVNEGYLTKTTINRINYYQSTSKNFISRLKFLMIEGHKLFLSEIQEKIIELLGKKDYLRRDLVKELNSARTTIYDNLYKLERWKIVERYTRNLSIRSRPLTFWTLLDKNIKIYEMELIE